MIRYDEIDAGDGLYEENQYEAEFDLDGDGDLVHDDFLAALLAAILVHAVGILEEGELGVGGGQKYRDQGGSRNFG